MANAAFPAVIHSASADLGYVVPKIRTKVVEHAFSVAGPTAWNSLPADIRRATDTAVFKRQLKTHYFNRAFNVYFYLHVF